MIFIIGHGIFHNGGIYDALYDPNAPPSKEIDRRPLRDRITHDGPGSLRIEAEGIDQVHEHLDAQLKRKIQQEEERAAQAAANGGFFQMGIQQHPQQPETPLPEPPTIKSVKMMEKDGSWTEYVVVGWALLSRFSNALFWVCFFQETALFWVCG